MPISYDPILVIVSAFAAILAAFIALEMTNRLLIAKDTFRTFWLTSGSIALGSGIWTMHFIGMLAVSLPIGVTYNVPILTASLLLPVIAAFQALSITCRPVVKISTLIIGGVVAGLGIAIMHYVGMAAMQMSADLSYNPILFALSVFIAIAVSYIALKLFLLFRESQNSSKRLKLLSAIAMGLAITSMHYTGMAAVIFVPNPNKIIPPSGIDSLSLAYLVCFFAVFVLGLMFALIYIEPKPRIKQKDR
ncbi:MHYT domain-containing protein [Egbenema bharatensis]|uniref:MHYT domain-containing protein n=1 Tax=Egbenema bharatensis TaxID=3463334 RepID=UPI003A8A6F0A